MRAFSRWKDALGTLLALLYGLPAIAYPFGNDQALHWYLGWRWLHGELPFVSGISSKPPGIFAVHALSIALFGANEWAIRISELVTVVLVGYVLAYCVRMRPGRPVDGWFGLGALVFSGVYYTFFDYWDTAHPELWEGLCLVSAFAVAAHATHPWKRDAGAGALCMAAFMFKYPAALPNIVVIVLVLLRALRARPRTEPALKAALLALCRYACGVLPVLLLVILPFALGGRLETMWEIMYTYIFHYAEKANYTGGVPGFVRIEHAGGLFVLTALSLLWSGVLATERRDRPALERVLFLAAFVLMAAGAVVVQKRFFEYHWVPMSPACAASMLLALTYVPRVSTAPSWLRLGVTTLLVALVALAGPRWIKSPGHSYKKHIEDTLAYLGGEIDRDTFLEPYRGRSTLDRRVMLEHVAAKIRAVARPGDTLCSRGFGTAFHPLTKLTCPSRHIVQDNVPAGLPGWNEEYRSTLERTPPTFVVTFSDRPRDVRYLESRGYGVIGREGKFLIMSLRKSPTSAALPAIGH
jgi:hypothetical protein